MKLIAQETGEPAMPARIARLFPQPAISVPVSLFAVLALTGAWLTTGLRGIALSDLPVAVMLLCWVVAAYRFPIHIRRSYKVEMITVSLYLMAVYLPSPALAATCAAIGVMAGEMLVRRERGNYYCDVLTATGRWAIVVLAGATFYHALGHHPLAPVAAAIVLWACDLLTHPLVIAPMTGEQ
ncbi:MAG: hypothetical protein ACJ78Q_20100, partial [Chloroflexia bacterium]